MTAGTESSGCGYAPSLKSLHTDFRSLNAGPYKFHAAVITFHAAVIARLEQQGKIGTRFEFNPFFEIVPIAGFTNESTVTIA
ncbi:hypothetical protein [Novipirellula aureliae]|uniref:hypothetical protein n=1 Tax=Novipirellula aureliae TaxID=2527966 RepID=UPI0011B3CA6A|nr:hypothetical protein [Novipirellula aureliae]